MNNNFFIFSHFHGIKNSIFCLNNKLQILLKKERIKGSA